MKHTFYLLVFLLVLAHNSAWSQGIGIGITNPHPSAALHIQSADQGLLIPKLDSLHRLQITNPASGLILYDTDLKSIMIFNEGEWIRIIDQKDVSKIKKIVDTDNDTGIDVEKFDDDDDNIRFQIENQEILTLNSKALELNSPGFSSFIGVDAGSDDDGSNNSNVFVGHSSGSANSDGERNSYIGRKSGRSNVHGDDNVYLGYNAGLLDSVGNKNVYLGNQSGEKVIDGNGNVFLGFRSGYNKQGNNQLIIHNDSSSYPLIYGKFDDPQFGINGKAIFNDTIYVKKGMDIEGAVTINNSYSLPQFAGTPGFVLKIAADGTTFWSIDEISDEDNDPFNEIETWSTLSGIPTGFQDNIDNIEDADSDASNEIQNLSIENDSLKISSGNALDLSSLGFGSSMQLTGSSGTTKAELTGSTLPYFSLKFDNFGRYSFRDKYFEISHENNSTLFSQIALSANPVNAVTLGYLAGPSDYGVAIGSFANFLSGVSHEKSIAIGDSTLFYGGSKNVAIGSKSLMGTSSSFPYESVAIGYEAGVNATGPNNTFIGYGAGKKITSGAHNIGIGEAMKGLYATATTSAGTSNIAMGFLALDRIAQGSGNIAIGSSSLFKNTGGEYNLGMGTFSLYNNTHGDLNIGLGKAALHANTTGSNNVAIGDSTSKNNVLGKYNVAIGKRALEGNNAGSRNTAIGVFALENYGCFNNTLHISANVAVGYGAMQDASGSCSSTGAIENVAVGNAALKNVGGGERNTAIGHLAGFNMSSFDKNIFAGYKAGYNMNSYENSVVIGAQACEDCDDVLHSGAIAIGYKASLSGIQNNTIAIGREATNQSVVGENNVYLGAFTSASANGDNQMALGYQASATASNQVRLGNTAVTSIGGFSNWTNISDGRFKSNVTESIPGLDFINLLRPVQYTLNREELHNAINDDNNFESNDATIQSGFIAQEVENAASTIGFNFSGVYKPQNNEDLYGLKYAEFVVPLVKSVQEMSEQISNQSKIIEELENRLLALENKE
jgi:hypothetical protein